MTNLQVNRIYGFSQMSQCTLLFNALSQRATKAKECFLDRQSLSLEFFLLTLVEVSFTKLNRRLGIGSQISILIEIPVVQFCIELHNLRFEISGPQFALLFSTTEDILP